MLDVVSHSYNIRIPIGSDKWAIEIDLYK